jgi:hypothetical protein
MFIYLCKGGEIMLKYVAPKAKKIQLPAALSVEVLPF